MGRLTLEIEDSILRRAEGLAEAERRDPASWVGGLVEAALTETPREGSPLREFSDAEVLASADLQMPEPGSTRLSDLLTARGARDLSTDEEAEYRELMRVYQALLLRKAQGLAEAVRRGLREPLSA